MHVDFVSREITASCPLVAVFPHGRSTEAVFKDVIELRRIKKNTAKCSRKENLMLREVDLMTKMGERLHVCASRRKTSMSSGL